MSPAFAALHPSRRAFGSALLAGLAHLTVVCALADWFGFSVGLSPFSGYVAVGGLLLGAVPVAILVETRLVAPLVAVAVALTASAYGTWSVYVGPDVTPTPVDPTPFGWYLIAWVIVLGAALVTGGVEYGLRRVLAGQHD